jgi:alpha-galactosidase
MIGAGSIGFTRRLLRDLLAVPELTDTHFHFMDISEHNLDLVTRLCRRDVESNRLPAQISATTDQREAITDADYVFCLARVGGLDAFELDIEIPLKYGVDQCVGDTLSAGGIMYAQRTIPVLLDICKDMREVAKPGALFMNYANPMAMNTWACNQYGGVQTIGLCHGVQGTHWQITRALQAWARREGLISEETELHRDEVTLTAAGINHQTWVIQARWRDLDLIPIMYDLLMAHPYYPRCEPVRLDVLKRFGYYSTESNGHMSEYLPWYRKRPEEIPQWVDLSSWINGETGGYLRERREARIAFEYEVPKWLNEAPPTIGPSNRSDEHGSYIIEALETGRVYRGHFNVINHGHITNLPDGAVIEIPGYVDDSGINMTHIGDLPLACAATCTRSILVQQMGMEAAVHGDVTLLKQAMLHDPQVGAVCNTEEIWQMTDEMLVAQEVWLPQYARSLPTARQRLADHKRNGTRVPQKDWEGAARLPMRSEEEIRAEVMGEAQPDASS